jgi:hypothetical protein
VSDPLWFNGCMKKQTRNQNRVSGRASLARVMGDEPTIEQLEHCDIEYMTVPAFIHRQTGMSNFDDMTRFGDRVGRVADAMQLIFQTTMHRQLGPLRAFPRPLLERVYRIMSRQLGWPELIETPALNDGQAEQNAADGRVEEHLRVLREAATDERVRESIDVVLGLVGVGVPTA